MENDLPSSLGVDVLSVSWSNGIGNDLDLLCLLADQVRKQSLDDWLHTAGQDDNRDVVLSGVHEEILEARVEGDVLDEVLDALVIRSGNAIHHLSELLSEAGAAIEDSLVAGLALLSSESDGVSHEIIAVGLGDGAVEVGKEDELWVRLHGRGGCVYGTHYG